MANFPFGLGPRLRVRNASTPLQRLAGGNVRVNSVPAVPSYQLTRLGSGNVRVETV